jgi:hypothetical protein
MDEFTSAIPDIAGLPCDRLIDLCGDEYMRRYYITAHKSRFHHILNSDPDDDMHDHPWDFVSKLLSGMYIEHTPTGDIVYRAPCIIHRKAEQLHKLELPEGPVWSFVLLGPLRRKWGFSTPRGWVAWDKYPTGGIAGCAPENPVMPSPSRHRQRSA